MSVKRILQSGYAGGKYGDVMPRIFDAASRPGYHMFRRRQLMPDLFEIARWTARPVTPGEYLRRLLAYLDVTQEELAAALDTSRFTVNQIVTGMCALHVRLPQG